MLHAHMAFGVIGVPRIDKIEVPREKADEGEYHTWVEIEVLPNGVMAIPQSEAADRLAASWDRGFTEFNVAPGSASADEAVRSCRLGRLERADH